jgi:hypothetical protein
MSRATILLTAEFTALSSAEKERQLNLFTPKIRQCLLAIDNLSVQEVADLVCAMRKRSSLMRSRLAWLAILLPPAVNCSGEDSTDCSIIISVTDVAIAGCAIAEFVHTSCSILTAIAGRAIAGCAVADMA